MAKKKTVSRKTAHEIIAETMPGMAVVEAPPVAADAGPRQANPGASVEALVSKYRAMASNASSASDVSNASSTTRPAGIAKKIVRRAPGTNAPTSDAPSLGKRRQTQTRLKWSSSARNGRRSIRREPPRSAP